jgi:hypothetical protein
MLQPARPARCLNCGRIFSEVDEDGCVCHDPENLFADDDSPAEVAA